MIREISIKDDNYIQISGWMLNELNLKGNELLIYALIHGFSQDGRSDYHGGLGYIALWTNSTKQGVIKALKSLLDKGHIVKLPVQLPDGTHGARYWTLKSRTKARTSDGKKESLPLADNAGKQSLTLDRSTEFTTIHTDGVKLSLPPNSTEFNGDYQLSLPNKNSENTNSAAASINPQKIDKNGMTEVESKISAELRKLFGGHLVFDTDFVPKIAMLTSQFGIPESGITDYLSFVLRRTEEKNPRSLTNLFHKLAQSPSVIQDFILERRKTCDNAVKDRVTCPVCGNENARRFESCKVCHFNMNNRTDKREIALNRQIFGLPEETRNLFLAEYNEEIKRQLSFGFLEKMHNPKLMQDFRERIAEIYRKYGITA